MEWDVCFQKNSYELYVLDDERSFKDQRLPLTHQHILMLPWWFVLEYPGLEAGVILNDQWHDGIMLAVQQVVSYTLQSKAQGTRPCGLEFSQPT